MISITDLEEKELLIAYYFARKEKVSLDEKTMLELWNNWWKQDFTKSATGVLTVRDKHLSYRNRSDKNDTKLLAEIDTAFQKSYEKVLKLVILSDYKKIEGYIEKLRNKQRYELSKLAVPIGYKVNLITHDISKKDMVAHYIATAQTNDGRKIRKNGTYSSILSYIKNTK